MAHRWTSSRRSCRGAVSGWRPARRGKKLHRPLAVRGQRVEQRLVGLPDRASPASRRGPGGSGVAQCLDFRCGADLCMAVRRGEVGVLEDDAQLDVGPRGSGRPRCGGKMCGLTRHMTRGVVEVRGVTPHDVVDAEPG
jgi:hypothetical protein